MLSERIRQLNTVNDAPRGKCVLYVMSRDQRVQDNHALIAAQQSALELQLPLVVFFNVLTKSGVRSKEHYDFMLEGLEQVKQSLQTLGIGFVLWQGDAQTNLASIVSELKPSAIYFDFSPLKGPRNLREGLAQTVKISCYEVDTHNIIPVWVTSDHQEFAAHTIRPKIHRLLSDYLVEPETVIKHPFSFDEPLPESHNISTDHLPSTNQSITFTSGEAAATQQLESFMLRLDKFALERNNPNANALSNLSPYLHFGQIASLRVALDVIKTVNKEPYLYTEPKMAQAGTTPSKEDGMNALLEEMIVRKELSDNFCLYSPSYRDFSGLPAWAQATLNDHRKDKREFTYTRSEWELAKTHDSAWNSAQMQLLQTGKMHGYMRMYWAKKMLEWSTSPEEALADCVYLNDKYSLDGGDPNGYVGILWSIGGLHDRPWTERPVFGKIRYMNYSGLKRKFDIESYEKTWNKQIKLV